MVDAFHDHSDRDRMPTFAARKRARDAELDGAASRATRARRDGDQFDNGSSPSFSPPLSPSLHPLPVVLHARRVCRLDRHAFFRSLLCLAFFFPGRLCVQAAGPIIGSRFC